WGSASRVSLGADVDQTSVCSGGRLLELCNEDPMLGQVVAVRAVLSVVIVGVKAKTLKQPKAQQKEYDETDLANLQKKKREALC
ncbi:hypothetical protein C5167_033364, partial [Papaver somniferum]